MFHKRVATVGTTPVSGTTGSTRPVSDTVTRESYARRMNLRTLVVVGILVAGAFSLSVAMITHDGVGAFEWIVGIIIVVGLLLLATKKSLRALGRS